VVLVKKLFSSFTHIENREKGKVFFWKSRNEVMNGVEGLNVGSSLSGLPNMGRATLLN
jgi:hypothetical protein